MHLYKYMYFNRPTKTANNTLGVVNKYYIGRVIKLLSVFQVDGGFGLGIIVSPSIPKHHHLGDISYAYWVYRDYI